MKLAVFDYDSTLMDGETLEFLAREFKLENEVREITNKAMNGELDFFESLTYRVSLLKGLSIEKVDKICKTLPLMRGAREVVTELKKMGYTTVCFSGGFQNATNHTKQEIGLDADFSNIFHVKDGLLTGKVGGSMMFGFSKGEMIQNLQGLLKVTPENTVAVGDGANDLSMFKYAKYKIAFCAKPILKQAANIIIDEKNLALIPQKLAQFN